MASTAFVVTDNATKNPHATIDSGKEKPDHWVDKKGSSFTNPWPSWRWIKAGEIVRTAWKMAKLDLTPDPKAVAETLPLRTPTWGAEVDSKSQKNPQDSIRATWLGHACFLVEFPSHGTTSSEGNRGVRILFDPVFSDRCSPMSFMGPKRYTQPPCKLEELPEIDAIVISHNHYDHLDTHSIKTLVQRSPERIPHVFVPLGNGPLIKSLGIPDASAHIMDWWDSKHFEISVPSTSQPGTSTILGVDVTCTPCQHFSGRMWRDNFKTLWASWVVEETAPQTETVATKVKSAVLQALEGKALKRVFFGGDTGYRTVPDDKDENEVPFCPAFKDIGNVFESFDLAMLPIGAYSPRPYMSPVHCSPSDSVRIYQDIKAKKGLGMHWGAWALTAEPFAEPPKLLAEEVKKAGIPEEDFTICDIGETVFF
ncbi:hypothetical protein D9611_001532 [Ephemerocybe angulata]|uniref:Metallo-beta-lactamase domain-containing protein n=1 Tax=Ephemerocybe angulata TaxID=980116 RepID=A0A8H5CIM6_9AGAR|nr:hypothetical protein D9611_001532 [Tulosesus angulatus]